MSNETAIADVRSYRISNIDMMRGLVIIIMALDHVRDFFYYAGAGANIDDPTISLGFYLTRWVTHFCAPVFVLLAGTSIGLMEARKDKKTLSKFLLKRGIWLVVCEFLLVSTAFTFKFFNPVFDGAVLAFLQVIWALGVSMIIMAGAIYLGTRTCLIIGAVIISGQEFLLAYWPEGTPFAGLNPFWVTLLTPGTFLLIPFFAPVMYPPIQWAAIMMIGYGTVGIFQKSPDERDMLLRKIGLIMILAFFVVRSLDMVGNLDHWQQQELGIAATIYDYFNVSKYPPSLAFFLITVGPMAIVCSYADRWSGWFKETLVMFGKVPFAFYLVHFYLIHSLSVLFGMSQGFEAGQMMNFFPFYPEGFGTNLLGVYVAWLVVMAIMYPFCKWMVGVKSRRKDWWLSYI